MNNEPKWRKERREKIARKMANELVMQLYTNAQQFAQSLHDRVFKRKVK